MPRSPRLDYPGAHHHVMNRGLRRNDVFHNDEACSAFLDLLSVVQHKFGLGVHGYALMGNHFHLLFTSHRGNLAPAMGFLQSRFTQSVNRLHGWDGPLFRGRYRNRLVESDDYWRHLLAYVHLNPVKANLVKKPSDARWTSHRAYLGLDGTPEWLDTSELLSAFGSRKAIEDYVAEVHMGRTQAPADFDADELWAPTSTAVLPPPKTNLRSPKQALADVREVTRKSQRTLMQRRRGRPGNVARWLAFWWLREGAGLGTNDIARQMKTSPEVVGRALANVDRGDARLKDWQAALASRLD